MVHKTQSAVSMQIKRLEERLGRAVFARDGRQVTLTEEGERLLDYARRIVRLNLECLDAIGGQSLVGRVRLGIPDDYADRYLPAILARFSQGAPRVEVTVTCEPSPNLRERIEAGELDLAIVTHVEAKGPSEILRREELLWVTSARHATHEETPLPLALGRPCCDWRQSAIEALEAKGRPHRVLFASWHSAAVGAAVLSGLAVSVLPESAVRPGMRVLTAGEGFPALPSVKIGMLRNRRERNALSDALADHIAQSLGNPGTAGMGLIAAE
jgi:DNA-binding transcriptional LysR family regulator